MDNAGRHGTNAVKDKYIRILNEEFNAIVLWQIFNSPEMNMLNLGACLTIQYIVAHMHRGKLVLKDALCKTVYHVFDSLESVKLSNIAKQWEYVLDLIVLVKGSNDFVKLCHGLTTSLADLPNLDYDDNIGMAM
jgi:hypothetical protein